MTSKYGFFGATAIALFTLAFAPSASAQTMGSTNLMVVIPARAALTVNTPTPAFTSTNDSNSGTTNFSYFIRASQTSGTGSIALKIDSNAALTYTCATKVGAACSIAQKANTATATPIVSFGVDTKMGLTGASGAINWSLPGVSNESAAKASTATIVISTI